MWKARRHILTALEAAKAGNDSWATRELEKAEMVPYAGFTKKEYEHIQKAKDYLRAKDYDKATKYIGKLKKSHVGW